MPMLPPLLKCLQRRGNVSVSAANSTVQYPKQIRRQEQDAPILGQQLHLVLGNLVEVAVTAREGRQKCSNASTTCTPARSSSQAPSHKLIKQSLFCRARTQFVSQRLHFQ
eukprot:GILJ01013525.1.p1 GENE.GILJ01013525.1~~GILJ01013525.1.p1  ORF type:complete len:110 (-),score=8.03 GILJ01013525.1:98-427(-)